MMLELLAEEYKINRSEMPPELLKEENKRSWSEMPLELLESFSDRLPLQNFLRFRSVCKHWLLASSRRSYITHFSRRNPWLMFYGIDDMCYFYSDSHGECWPALSPHLRGATCVESRFGWLLARHQDGLFFYNPFTLQRITLQKYPHLPSVDQFYTISAAPTSPDCTVCIIRRINAKNVEICSCSVGDRQWRVFKLYIDGGELGTLKWAKFGISKVIFICDVNDMYASYDFVKGRTRLTKLPASNAKPGYVPLFKKMSRLHRPDWLAKFGRNGICISTCSLTMALDGGYGGFSRSSYNISVDGRADTQVKAAWVTPPPLSSFQCSKLIHWRPKSILSFMSMVLQFYLSLYTD